MDVLWTYELLVMDVIFSIKNHFIQKLLIEIRLNTFKTRKTFMDIFMDVGFFYVQINYAQAVYQCSIMGLISNNLDMPNSKL